MINIKPRVRFAPSPTGQLHLGGARTALFNYLFAKKCKGEFVLRIEDTDKIRSKQEYTDQICESLKWLGLNLDEEVIYQSKRGKLYQEAVDKLLKSGNAYRCFCSKDKLQMDRERAEKRGEGYLYPGNCRSLDENIVKNNLQDGVSYCVRIRIPNGFTNFNDRIYGDIRISNNELDDFIIARTDGNPVYNLVVAVDDNDMKITHIIRGEDHISNTPKQIIIYEALNLPIPIFAHLPMILGADRRRLSKRHGATGVQAYRDFGYLAAALNNYLALLGWNPGTEKEIFSMNELIEQFDIDRVQKKSAVFDERKLQWVSAQHLKNQSAQNLLKQIRKISPSWRSDFDDNYILQSLDLMKDRSKSISDLQNRTEIFFNDPTDYDPKGVRKNWKDLSVNNLITKFIKSFKNIELWDAEQIEIVLRSTADSESISAGTIIHPTRLALTGLPNGPSLFTLMELLGKETCIRRLETGTKKLPFE